MSANTTEVTMSIKVSHFVFGRQLDSNKPYVKAIIIITQVSTHIAHCQYLASDGEKDLWRSFPLRETLRNVRDPIINLLQNTYFTAGTQQEILGFTSLIQELNLRVPGNHPERDYVIPQLKLSSDPDHHDFQMGIEFTNYASYESWRDVNAFSVSETNYGLPKLDPAGKIPFSWCPDPDDDFLDLYGLFTTPPPRVSRGKLKGRLDALASIDTEMSSKSLGREAVEKAARAMFNPHTVEDWQRAVGKILEPDKMPSGLVDPPKPMKPMDPETYERTIDELKRLFSRSPSLTPSSTPGVKNTPIANKPVLESVQNQETQPTIKPKEETKMALDNKQAQILANLANVSNLDDEFAQLGGESLNNPELRAALEELRATERKDAVKEAAVIILAQVKEGANNIDKLRHQLAQIRRSEAAVIASIEAIAVANEYGRETNNYLPLAALNLFGGSVASVKHEYKGANLVPDEDFQRLLKVVRERRKTASKAEKTAVKPKTTRGPKPAAAADAAK